MMNSKSFYKTFLCLSRQNIAENLLINTIRRPYSVAVKKSKLEKIEENVKVEVEKDAQKLVAYVCGTNLLAEGGEDLKIKSDSEYPEWLWSIHIGAPLPLEKLDPNTKTYWNRVRRMGEKEEARLLKLQKHKTLQK